MRIRGSGGALHVGYQLAANLGDWTLTRTRAGEKPAYNAEAQILSSDTYWIQQRPMKLELAIGHRAWAWNGVQPTITNESLAVMLTGGPSIH